MQFEIFSLIFGVCLVAGLDNGLVQTPPMGWIHWQRYRCNTKCDKYPNECIHENLFKKIADIFLKDGYADVGYEYIIMDDCWLEKERNYETRKLEADRKRFPSGLKKLAEYIHERGLKFGLSESYGFDTCSGYPGIMHNMKLDAQTFANWDVDYIKLDGCNSNIHQLDSGYAEFGRYLNQTGRKIVYSCTWPSYQLAAGIQPDYSTIAKYCNLWRSTNDIQDSYNSFTSIMNWIAKEQDLLQPIAGPGHWNDPDSLLIGNFGLSIEQSRQQMAIWAIVAAPLLMSNDLTSITQEFKDILLNKEIIAINQDFLGMQGRRIYKERKIEIWIRPIAPIFNNNYSYAIAFISKRTIGYAHEFKHSMKQLGLQNKKYLVIDLFNKNFTFWFYNTEVFETRINPNSVRFYKFTATF